jgi:hypothetical protein
MNGTTDNDSSAMVTFNRSRMPNITISEMIDVASGKIPLMTRFSIEYASSDRQRPRLQRAEADLQEQKRREDEDALPVGTQERQRPEEQVILHPPTFLGGSTGRGGTRFGAILGMISGTTRSWLESAT